MQLLWTKPPFLPALAAHQICRPKQRSSRRGGGPWGSGSALRIGKRGEREWRRVRTGGDRQQTSNGRVAYQRAVLTRPGDVCTCDSAYGSDGARAEPLWRRISSTSAASKKVFLDPGHYNFGNFENYHYNSSNYIHAIIIPSLFEPHHFVRMSRPWAHL